MKTIVAPGSFKESLSTGKCHQVIKAGFSAILPDAHYICLPIADSDERTVNAMVAVMGDSIVTLKVCGPVGETVNVFYGLTGGKRTAITEMAAANGPMLVAPGKRNPLLASSFGTGELIRHALNNDIRHIILGIGGSTTIDSGMGVAQVLGIRFLDADGQVLAANGGNLARVASIEMDEYDPRLANYHIEVACDVNNPLIRARGATTVFGPQKGATPGMAKELEQGLQNYVHALQRQTEINVYQVAGGGTAGGVDIVATVFLNADIKPGIEIVLSAISLAQAVQGAAPIITGEGRIDSQTVGDKAPLSMVSAAKQSNVPMTGTVGVLGDGIEVVHQYGIDAVFSILPRLAPLVEVLASGETNLFNSARNIACTARIGQGIKNWLLPLKRMRFISHLFLPELITEKATE